MSSDYTAIDFETAQGKRYSICQVGLIRVVNGKIVKEISRLVRPPKNYYWNRFIEIHGITAKDTEDAPNFAEIWKEIESYIRNQTVVAHNGMAFDFPVLEKTLEFYNMLPPSYTKRCTYKIYRKNLASLCDEYQIPLNHHDALSDARACAQLFHFHITNSKMLLS
ncbi:MULTISPECIES: 3'-5' exonuclease [unclassified Oceanispirochaeta]|uniref:3'-5' exonuclease n=1 Tax=unclassified Oceanispirochaeta TaxID=2635722 RepID=UPI000E08D5C7|nr:MULTISPECIES: 3'-5' exonuclease [unclassified Oceanispirochaeta]MBF9014142.1 3'-5' exonuclease [Oceanispirochaeta sp. M2]NPD70632.1 3'-5' exonuclease [Oceanispirochaeta sp. M1]RDG34396.1 exonuclease [Oceanispirochaeta sp. M1]